MSGLSPAWGGRGEISRARDARNLIAELELTMQGMPRQCGEREHRYV